MKILLASAMAIGLASLPVQQALACSCAEGTIEQAAAAAHAVFAGTVIDQKPVGLDTGPVGAVAATGPMPIQMGSIVYTFAVDGVAKGDVASHAQVVSGGEGNTCGMAFGINERWLVFTTWDGSIHSTGLCSGNMPLGADEDPPLAMSAPIAGEVEQPMEIPWTALAVLTAVLVLAGVSAFAFRRSSPTVV
jgi:hypothetical protein